MRPPNIFFRSIALPDICLKDKSPPDIRPQYVGCDHRNEMQYTFLWQLRRCVSCIVVRLLHRLVIDVFAVLTTRFSILNRTTSTTTTVKVQLHLAQFTIENLGSMLEKSTQIHLIST